MERFFVTINRINSVIFLVVLLATGGMVLWLLGTQLSSSRDRAITVASPEGRGNGATPLRLGSLEHISGSDTDMLSLTSSKEDGKFSSGGYGSDARNILFLNGEAMKPHWLFANHNNLILRNTQLKQSSSDDEKGPALALYFEYIAKDSNGDGKLSSLDTSTVALTLPDGSGFTDILHDVDRVFSFETAGDKQLSILYQKGKSIRHARVSIATMQPTSDQEVIQAPDPI